MTAPSQGPEWPLTVAAVRVTAQPLRLSVEAGPAVREALAGRFAILAIDSLAADVALRRLTDGDIAASARLRARLQQACVVTLEPVAESIDVTIEGRFTHRASDPGDPLVLVDPDDETDEPEPIVDGTLALGEWLAQQLSLAMDAYPRAAGAAVERTHAGEAPETGPASPFGDLARLRKDSQDG